MSLYVNRKDRKLIKIKRGDRNLYLDNIREKDEEICIINSKNAIVILTRGYKDFKKYSKLIRRNIFINEYLSDKTIPLLIFHEGNITMEHQTLLKQITKNLILIFIDISSRAFLKEKQSINPHKKFQKSNIGYRHMCHFWFVDFWHFVEEYENILRIDEDCYITFDPVDIFSKIENKVAIYGHWEKDAKFVTIGLTDFTKNFLGDMSEDTRIAEGPYTNVICFNLKKLRENEKLFEYINMIDKSENIYIYRWGDLPLWGEVLKYLYDKDSYNLDKTITYHHESHGKNVN